MAKQLNVNLAFTADTSQAKAQVQELQATLNQIAYAGNSATGMNKQTQAIQQASAAAKELQLHLNNAFDTTTGRFDLSKLDKSLKTSSSNIGDLATKLAGAGQTGQQAFAQLAQSIASANQPMFILNSKLAEMWTVMKNTMRWQLSSSMIHGFMGTVQQAYGYVQDLNESLNNIRIVTGYSSEEMAVFAKEANKAAKALSTTTTEYTDASLIYYQQGLSDAEVKERTDVTIKMANAAGQSAQIVSDQMTAVWNNFDDGSKSIEYYADVMTALGAATASSTDEIAAGLEKFAAIAETVGLSYEYSTAALATITANTRQSADVVGNALKTLFARIQGLKLGETLEDGVDLNKYSKALAVVGVDVLTANGELRNMDDILVDLAAKWDTIGKAEQTALAQTVAGVRQYTQLVALMDNWDDMKVNLDVAYNAEGTLDEQQKIYEESWQAAIDKVKAASEGIYDSLLNDDFFIGLNNGFAEVLGGVELFIDGIGGAKGAIIALSTILISSLSHKIPQAIDNLVYNFKFLTKGANEAYKSIQNDMNSAFDKTKEQFYVKDNAGIVQNDKEGQPILNSTGTAIKYANELTAARTKLAMVSKTMSNAERQLAEMELSLIEADQQRVVSLKQKNEELQRSIQITNNSYKDSIKQKMDDAGQMALNTEGIGTNLSNFLSTGDYASKMREAGISMAKQITEGMMSQGQEFNIRVSEIYSAPFEKLQNFKSINIDESNYQKVVANISALIKTMDEGTQKTLGLDKVLKTLGKDNLGIKDVEKALNDTINKMTEGTIDATNYQRTLKALFGEKKGQVLIEQFEQLKANGASTDEIMKRLKETMAGFNPVHIVRTYEALGAMAGVAGTAAMAINSIKSLWSTWTNPDASGWEKLSSTLMTFSMIVPGITSGMKSLGTVTSWSATQALSLALATDTQTAATTLSTLATEAKEMATQGKTAAEIKNILIEKLGTNTTNANTIAELLSKAAIDGKNLSLAASVGLWLANTAALSKYVLVQKIAMALMGKFGGLMLGTAFIGIGAAIFLAIKGLDALIVTQKEATEAIETANKAYEEEQNKLKDLNSELETTKDRIKELEALDSLTIVEQAELNKLKQTETSLERQIELQERLASLKRRDAVNEIAENWEKSAGNIGDKDTAHYFDPNELGMGTWEGIFKYHMSGGKINKIGAEAYIKDKEAEWEAAKENGTEDELDFTWEDLEGWKSYIDDAYQDEYAEEALSIMENFQTLQDMYNEAKEAGNEEEAQDYLKQISDMTSSDQFSKAMEVTYGDDYEKEVLGGFAKENLTSTQIADIIKGKQADFDEDKLALEGINATDLSNYIANGVEALQKENGLTEDQLLTLTPEQLLTLIENQSDIENTDLSGLDDIGLKNYVDGIQTKTPEQIKQEADARGVSQAESYGLDVDQFKAYRDILYETNDDLKEQPELLNKIAIAQLRLNKGAKSIKDSYDDLSPLIKKAQKEMSSKNGKVAAETWSEISSYMTDATTAMEDMLNLDKGALDNLNPEFLVENYDLLTQAANGSKEAFDKLQKVMGQELAESLGLTGESYQQLISDIVDASANMEVGDVADNALSSKLSSMYNQAYDAAIQGGKSVADAMAIANDMVNNVGFDMPDIEMETITAYVPKKLPDTITPNIDGIVDTGDLRAAGISWSRTPGPGFTEPITITVPKTSNVNFTKSSETVGGGGSSKGGGGGGGSKKPQKKNDSDKERYHTVKNQLEDLKDAYDDVSEAADRAFGAEKLALMEEEIAKTDDLIAKQEEYVDAIEANLEPDKQAFVGLYDKYIQGPEIQFDANGNISNFDEIQDAMYDLYNKNADTMSESEWEIFEEHYKQVEEYMKQYEETYDLLREEENELQDLVNQRIDLLLEKVKYEIELKLSVSEDSLEVLDYQLSRLEDDAYAVAEVLGLLGKSFVEVQTQLETNIKGMQDVLKQSGVSDVEIQGFIDGSISIESLTSKYSFTEEQIEALRQYKSGALDTLEAMEQLREEAQNKVSEAFDAWNEQLQESLDKFDHLNNVLQSYKNIIDIVGESMLGITDELMDNLNEAIIDNAINQLDSSRRAWEALQDAEKTAKDALAEAYKSGNEEDIKYWEGEVERINQEAAAAQETMLTNWENTLTLIVEQFEKAVEDAVESFNKSFTSDGTFLSDAYDKRQKENERYIEDYQKIYELSKLTRDINNSIDDSDNLASKAKLKELLGEINEYEAEGVEMSEYDVEYLQKKYDLYKAQIALEEAQAAKDTVRLTKDNEGNWSYAYTTDSSKIEQAEQEYEDALYALQELNYEYLEELESSIVDTMEEMGDALANIKREDFATYEEYQAEIDRVTAFYMDQIAYYQSEMQSGIDRNKELYEEDWQAYNRITGYKISANEDFITSWKETTLGGLTESESETVDIYQRVVDSLDVLIAGLLEAYRVMSEDIDEANEAAGTSTENFGEHVGDVTTQVQDDSEAAGEAVDDMANQMEAGFEAATTALLKWQSQYSVAMEQAITDTLGVVDAFNLLIKTLAEGKPTVDASKNNSNNSNNNSTGGQSSGSNSNKNNTSNSGNNSKNQTSTTYFDRQEYDAEQVAKQKQENQRVNSRNRAITLDEKQKHGFATGGYTGNWGDTYGRLAWLHKKELVLNQQDTSNILLTVQLVRQLAQTIDLNAQSASAGIGLLTALSLRDEKQMDTLQQEVTIHAEFPNVQDQNEIKLALSDLVNTASQYANRK